MARTIPGQQVTGIAEVEVRNGQAAGTWDVFVMPSDERIREGGLDPKVANLLPIRMYLLDLPNERVRIFPVFTRPEPDGQFTQKHKKIRAISFDWWDAKTSPDESEADSALDYQPDGLTRDPNYGLGLKKEYRFILDAIAELTEKEVIYIGDGEPQEDEFQLSLSVFKNLVVEIDRIDRRALTAENEVKATTSFNMIAAIVGKEPRPFRLGRNEIRQLIQKFAADPDFRDPNAQLELVSELGRAARTIALRLPQATDKLVSDLQLSRVRTHSQNMTTAARAQADMKMSAHLS